MNLSDLFLHERNIPYSIPLSADEVDNCCAGKHIRLKKAFEKEGMTVRDRICWFRWADLPLPKEILDIPHDNETTHLYLEILRDGEWRIVDASWDPGISSVLPVNDWDDSKDVVVAVPVHRCLSPEESVAYMSSFSPADTEKELKRNGEFYRALNAWLATIRESHSQ